MSNLRFTLIAVALFAGTFVGVSWASKGFPVMAMRVVPMKPEAPAHEEQANQQPALEPEVRQRPPTGRAPDQLSLTAIQAADAYARAPCDAAAKAAFVVAASTYLRAKATGPNAATPPDARVHQAIKAAIEAGDISPDEFPSGLGISVAAKGKAGSRCLNAAGLRP